MEEPQSLHTVGEEETGDDFYEKIEAPKFVDLNAPDRNHPRDDRYWFCLRVGCDQKHEEELDSEAIYRDFVLRVMAARSPNIRLRKALFSKESRKCPQTVPAKSSKPRVAKLALISSMSKRIVDPKVKVKPISKQSATPNLKGKQSSVSAKAMTTQGNKRRVSNPKAFRSVRNSKSTTIVLPKNKSVAKTLVFDSPKKSDRTKTSLELSTPVKTLCASMKKLQINGGNKHDLGYKPSEVFRKLRGREVKSRVFDGLRPQNPKGQDDKSSKCLNKKKKEKNLQQCHGPGPCEGAENDISKIEAEESRNGSVALCSTSRSDGGEGHEESLTTVKISKPSVDHSKVEVLSESSTGDLNSLPSLEEKSIRDNIVTELQAPTGEVIENSVRGDVEEERKLSLDKGNHHIPKVDEEKNTLVSGRNEKDVEVMESDDKENALASDENRELELNNGKLESTIHGKHETQSGNQKIIGVMRKPSTESTIKAITCAKVLKHRKPKPTNPKPFRLRTDERRILKEATLEKKLHVVPLKEITSVPRLPSGSSQKNNKNAIQSNDKCQDSNYSCEEITKEMNRMQRDQQPQNRSSNLKISKERMRHKLSKTPQKHTVSSQQKLVTPKQQTNSPCVRQLRRTREVPSTVKKMVSMAKPAQRSVKKETLATKPVSRPSASAASTLKQEKKLKTAPKEPNFHAIHMPKSCAKERL